MKEGEVITIMKKLFLFLITLMFCITLTSCTGKNVNYFVAGPFVGENCYMDVLEITEEKYGLADGINVVQDQSDSAYNGKFYSISLYVYDDSTDTYTQAIFDNLSYTYRTTAEPCMYYDKNENYIKPDFKKNQTHSQSYSISYNEKGYSLTFKEEE